MKDNTGVEMKVGQRVVVNRDRRLRTGVVKYIRETVETEMRDGQLNAQRRSASIVVQLDLPVGGSYYSGRWKFHGHQPNILVIGEAA